MKKYRLKKSAKIVLILILIAIIALILFIISLFSSKSYSLEYNVDNYAINENYDKEEKVYYYEITSNGMKYTFISNINYQKNKKLIQGIKIHEKDGYVCLEVESSSLKTMPLCSYEGQQLSYYLIPTELQDELNDYYDKPSLKDITYENYHIYNTYNNILIWNYKGFNYLNGEDVEFIKLFDKDIYEIPLATKINNYLIVPDYEQEYEFNTLYIINLDNLKIDTWKMKYTISYDSYILGINDKSVYLVDKKNGIEYEIVPHKKKMRILASNNKNGIIYKNGEAEKINVKTLVADNKHFTYKSNYNYILVNDELYLYYWNQNNRIKVSNNKIRQIVYTNDDSVYYLVGNTLYKYNDIQGEVKLVEYGEWEFNYQNLIFINN